MRFNPLLSRVLLLITFNLLGSIASLDSEVEVELCVLGEAALVAEVAVGLLVVDVAAGGALQGVLAAGVADAVLALHLLAASRAVLVFFLEYVILKYFMLSTSLSLHSNLINNSFRQALYHNINPTNIHMPWLILLPFLIRLRFLFSSQWFAQIDS